MNTLRQLAEALTSSAWNRRRRDCRRNGHAWSPRTTPTYCGHCGTRQDQPGRWW